MTEEIQSMSSCDWEPSLILPSRLHAGKYNRGGVGCTWGRERRDRMFNHELRLQRATQHLENLEAEIQPWLEANSPTVRTTVDPCNGMKSLWVDEPFKQPPVHFGLIVGDCLHNLRSTLDNLVYALAVKHNGGPLDEEIVHRPMYPIFDNPKDFKDHGKWRLKDIAPRARQCIVEMQPFNQPHIPLERSYLWVLNELSNMDKHRVPHVALSVQLKGLGVENPAPGYERNLRVIVDWRTLNESKEIAEYPPAEGMNVFPLFAVGFGQEAPIGARGWPIDYILMWLRDSINEKVVPPLEEHLG